MANRTKWLLALVLLGTLTTAGFLSGLSGEIFLVSKAGIPMPAPGATVDIYAVKGKRVANFRSGPFLVVLDEHARRVDEILKPVLEYLKSRNPRLASNPEILENRISAEKEQYCSKLEMEIIKYWGKPVAATLADKTGKFSVRLAPGSYVISARGQAGTRKALWLEEIRMVWRSKIRMVDQICDHEVR